MPETILIACSLDEAQLPDRAAAMARLGTSLVAVQADGRRAELGFATDRERVDEFVRAESGCCPFFEFDVANGGGETTLRVGAPEGGEWAVRSLVAGFVAGWGGLV